jgi:hypothetical protein
MREKELRQICVCSSCGKGVMHTQLPLFWTVTVNRYGIKTDAVRRQSGLEMMMGDCAPLAQIMGPDEDMADKIMEEVNLTFCEECMMKHNLRLIAFTEHPEDSK